MEPTPRRAAPSATKKGKAIMSNPLFSGTRLDLVLFLLDGTLKQGLDIDTLFDTRWYDDLTASADADAEEGDTSP